MNITSFNYYYHRKHGKVPLPQIALEFEQRHGMTFSDMVLKAVKEKKK